MNDQNQNPNDNSLPSSANENLYARLIFLEGDKETARKNILRHCTLIGAASGCNIQLVSSTVSDLHCVITLESDRLELRDLRSNAGTLLNGSKIDHAVLSDGDIITVGKFQCRIESNFQRIFFDQLSEDENSLHAKQVEQAFSKREQEKSKYYARLVFEDKNSNRLEKNIFRHSTIIGSLKGCNIQLVARDISPAHSLIVLSHGLLYIHDLRSKAGTEVNDINVNVVMLADGDLIRLGRKEFRVETNLVPAFGHDSDQNNSLKDLSEKLDEKETHLYQKEVDIQTRFYDLDEKKSLFEKELQSLAQLQDDFQKTREEWDQVILSEKEELEQQKSDFESERQAEHSLKKERDEQKQEITDQLDQFNKDRASYADQLSEQEKQQEEFRNSKDEFENFRTTEEQHLKDAGLKLAQQKEEMEQLKQEFKEKLNETATSDDSSSDEEATVDENNDQEIEEPNNNIDDQWNNLSTARTQLRNDQTNFEIEQQRRSLDVELQLAEVERLHKELDARRIDFENEKTEHENKQSEVLQDHENLNDKKKDVNDQLTEIDNSRRTLEAKSEVLQTNQKALDQEIKTFEEKRKRITDELFLNCKEYEQEQSELQKSYKQLEIKQDELLNQIEKRAKAEAEFERRTDEIQQNQDDLQRKEDEFLKTHEQFLKDQETLLQQKKITEDKHSEADERNSSLSQREADITEREKELIVSREELEQDRGSFDEFVKEKSRLEEQKQFIEDKEKELEKLNLEISSLKEETNERHDQLLNEQEGLETKQTSFEKELLVQEMQLLEYQKQIELQNLELEQQKEELHKEKLEIKDEKSRLHSKAERLTQHAEQYEHRQSVQEGMAQQLDSQRNKLQADLNRIREEIKNSQSQLKQHQVGIEKERQELVWERRTFEQERRVFQQQKADFYREQNKASSDSIPTEKEISLTKKLSNRGFMTQFQTDWFLEGSFKNYLIDNQYELLSLLDTGGMGWLYCALDRKTGRKVVLKILQEPNLSDPGLLTRFRQEAKATLELHHANVIRSYYYGETESFHYLVMEYLEGINLIELVRLHGPIPYQMACSLIIQAAKGLKYIHSKNMVHRDVKPSNFLIDQKGQLKILDFGLVLINRDKNEDEFTLAMLFGHDCLGTADYIAPEQSLDSFQVDYRADLYSLGCAFYYALTGTVPFPEKSNLEKIEAHRSRKPQHVSQIIPDIPRPVVQIVDKLMSKHPDQRYQNIDELTNALKPYLKNLPIVFDHSIILKMREEKAKARLYRMGEMIQSQKPNTSDDTGAGDLTNARTFTDLRKSDPNL